MTGFQQVFRHEFRRVFTAAPVFAVIILGSAIYAILYPQPYVNEALRDVPIAVVDQDRTSASREFIRAVDASGDVAVMERHADMPSAERSVHSRSVYGILLIPRHFERNLLHGRQSPVAIYGDASYFLIYQRVLGAISTVAATSGARIEAQRLIAGGVDSALAQAAVDPMPLTAIALFNPEGGYATYILPAAFVLILQQVLLIGAGLLGTLPDASGDAAANGAHPGPVTVVAGKLAVYLVIEAVLLPLYLVVLPYMYGLPRLGAVGAILLFAVPFVLAVGSLGMVLAAIFRTAHGVQLATAALGLPLFFLAGFAWPNEAIPPAIRAAALLVPSTSAIEGLVNIAQLGASLSDVREHFLTLWTFAILYSGLAVFLKADGVLLRIRRR